MRLLPTLILLALLWFPSAASAGGYSVSACFGQENASWSSWQPTGGAVAYARCPGGVVDVARPGVGEGLMVRNVVVPHGHAVRGTTAALRFDAPAGTTIAGLDFDAKLLSNPGWSAGVYDDSAGRWLWCGTGCLSTIGQWIHREVRGLSSGRVSAVVRCDAARCRRDARHGYIALRNVRVYLEDGSVPSVTGVRGRLAGDGWLRGVQEIAFDAADNTGIARGRVERDGSAVHDDGRACDFTLPIPCANGTIAASLDTRGWGDGVHSLRLGAQDAAGNWAWTARTVRVDNTPPPEPVPALGGGAAWSAARTRTLIFPLPSGQAAPVTRARVRVCKAGGPCRAVEPALQAAASAATPASAAAAAATSSTPASAAAAGPRAGVPVEAFAGPGEYTLRAALEDAAGNVGPFAPPLTLRFDDTVPGAPDLAGADPWLNRGPLPLAAEAPTPLSGIRGYRVRIGGRDAVVATELPLDALPQGGTPIEVRAISGAGVASTAVRTVLKLDRTGPTIDADGLPAPDAWSRTPVRIGLRARDQAGLSGVASVGWSIDGDAEATTKGDEAAFEVAADGRHTIAYRALDGAGNASAPRTAAVKVDRTPPETVAFEAPDPADPTLVRVVVADATSGIARGRVELRRAGGGWRALPTSHESGRLLARVDDAALRSGRYELRAVVSDVAGNEAIGTARADGAPATVTLPLRKRTVLSLRRTGRTLGARLTLDGHPLAGRLLTLTRRLRGRTAWRTVCPSRTVLIAATPPSHEAPSSSGSTPTPKRGAATPSPGPTGSAPTPQRATAASGCGARTDGAGRVELRLRRGASRTVRLAFAGDLQLLPARASTTIRTPARARLRATPRSVPAGSTVRFSGRLLGGHLPPGGKLVELQARVEAGWRTFATVRTDLRGRYAHVHRFEQSSVGRSFWFRARVRRERAYPFERATTRPISVHVT